MSAGSALTFERDGAALHPGAATPLIDRLDAIVGGAPRDRAGVRLHGHPGLGAVLGLDTAIGRIAAERLGAQARPVRAILFDKTPGANWGLGWHQDRTVAVRARYDVPGYGPWSRKRREWHVEPPFAVIARMLTLRVHLDDVPADNAPLLIAPGSHRLGRIPAGEAANRAAAVPCTMCLARRGDVWSYATPILHASQPAQSVSRRRVLQVDFSTDRLEPPLDWLGV